MTRSGFADISGGRLHYELTGSGAPVVLMHGFTLDCRMWSDVTPRLAERHTVLSYDLRGFGKSSLPTSEPYAHRDDLLALLDALGLEHVHLVGHSVGGHQALEFVLAYPERVRSYTGIDVSALGGVPFPPDVAAGFAAISEAGKSDDLPRAKALWAKFSWFVPARERPAVARSLDAMLESYSGWHWQNQNPARPLEPPAAGRLAEVRAPALLIVGDRSLPYNHDIAERLVAGISGARLATIRGSGHMEPMEAPEETARLLRDFFG